MFDVSKRNKNSCGDIQKMYEAIFPGCINKHRIYDKGRELIPS